MSSDEMEPYFAGDRLYGDDFSPDQIREWFEYEQEGSADLRKNYPEFQYQWNEFYLRYGWNKLPAHQFGDLLAFGAADGQEVLPVATRFDRITIVEPSDQFAIDQVGGVPVRFVKPQMDGVLPFPDASFDVISCFGVLHHIPNVSKVVSEFARVLRVGGYAIIREPTVSMNDWRLPRAGLTKNERGIPLGFMRRLLKDSGLDCTYEKRFGFPLSSRLAQLLRVSPVRSRLILAVDTLASKLFSWNYTYHTDKPLLKLRPSHAIWVVQKSSSGSPM